MKMMTGKDCTCADWRENIDKLLMAVYLWAHGIEYTGVKMRYCPWCGAILTEGALRSWLEDKGST